ncbi:NAD(P)H-hydrate dehydratase [Paludisphaera borealis]|uniref:ADP-dependent (S)-NAD(P)H-hydrate dehydratase n=1 Tax=Paludisphaera borealis TaxID=1387353 RepID=A0A1U7CVH0_9BACT|nr:NAD(P)H-hydrate dehydratase [Paludisphaera borealis]APW62942.1 Bifunctional NAD(P)H-hydrate repair enzyme Nnr [Paludisphaera borealis]
MALERVESIPSLAPRPADSHKGRFGSILVVAGSRGMAGAAALAGASALRSGAGLVRVATAAEVNATVASFEPSYMTYPLPCDEEGVISFRSSQGVLERLMEKVDVVAVGPGLGQSDDVRALVRWLITSAGKTLVLDADALNALDGDVSVFGGLTQPAVVTPHPGEFARLVGVSVDRIQGDRENQAASLASRFGHLVVVLKGNGTVVTDGSRIYVNRTGNPGMATGGAGDALTGVVAALLGQKLSPFQAAQLGVYVHGLAGDIARDQNGEIGLIAGDVVDALPDAFDHVVQNQELHDIGLTP